MVTDRDVAYPLSTGERVRAVITLPDRVEAPVQKGTIAGKLCFWAGETPVGETYLLYRVDIPENVPEPTLFDRIKEFLQRGEGSAVLATAFLQEIPASPVAGRR